MPQRIEVVVGGQFGSEGKGHITAQLVKLALDDEFSVINIRVAGPNAGHTVYDDNGEKFALRQIPVGAVYPDVALYIAPGSEIDFEVLKDEINLLESLGHNLRGRLAISGEATLIGHHHKLAERRAMLVEEIGSTGKGIGAARASRIMRSASRVQDDESILEWLADRGIELAEPEDLYATDDHAHNLYQHLIVEGTQGYGLSMHAGHYPQVTSSDCRAIDFLAMAGISPWRCTDELRVWVVARVYPIRVAGNSGALKGETTWDNLGLEEERTTVTQKVRRVGDWDADLLRSAVQANGGHENVRIALTMVDQKYPTLYGWSAQDTPDNTPDPAELPQVQEWIEQISRDSGADVGAFTTSPTHVTWTSIVRVPDNLESTLEEILGENN